ncbi:hypothetical protein Taro_028214 [Colocasia esculenta]|uniref:Aminotransferase class V domain-containing protein n=1 Tax=Colocasia esculenta TaxID=4460 RepID=A0A843VHZ2_COLES|nr:hypothetical protein [Colocasia esculenta]
MPLLLMSPVRRPNDIHGTEATGPATPKAAVPDAEENGVAGASGNTLDLPGVIEAYARALQEDDDDSKLTWLASQVVGADAEFESPFGSRRITYCDHTAASGRFLQVIEDYLQREVLPYYGNTHTVDNYVGLQTSSQVREATRYIKSSVGAGPHDVLLFCGTGSTAAIKRLQEVMGITMPPILRSRLLDLLDPSELWVVFLGPYEHHSNLLSWRQSLAEVVEIGLDESGNIDVSALEVALASPEYAGRPKLGSFSACSNVTGVYTDTRALARLLHEHDAYACFDFACSGPYVEIDMRSGESDGYDAVFLSPHKFLGGPGSPGILLMSDALYGLKGAPPSTSGGGTVIYVNGYNEKETLYCEDLEEREDAGTPAIVQKVRAALAFAVKSYAGHGLIRGRETALARKALGRLAQNPRVQVLGGDTRGDRQPIVSFLVYPGGGPPAAVPGAKHLHCHFVTRLLNDLFGVQARGGCACAGPYSHVLLGICRERSLAVRSAVEKGYQGVKPGFTRVSFAYYTATEEMEYAVDAIEFVARYGHRFLPLYDFDWRSGAWDYTGGHGNSVAVATVAALRADRGRRCGGGGAAAAYDEYMRVARSVAEALRDDPVERPPPDGVDPQLVTFMV